MPAESLTVQKFRRPENLYGDMPPVPTQVDDCVFGKRLTEERWLAIEQESVLFPEEKKIANRVLMNNEISLAWTDDEKGMFKEEFIPPYKIPTIEHTPWRDKNIPIPPSAQKEITAKIREKINNGTYEPSQGSYSSSIFVVRKKDGTYRFVHNLQTLNSITVRDNATPPLMDAYVEEFSGLACVGLLDLYDGYGQYPLHNDSRDLTAFQTALGPMRLTTVPQGGSNSVGAFQRAMNFILADEFNEEATAYIDDVGVKGPKTRYEDENGVPERLKENDGVRQYVYEYLCSLNRVLWKMGKFGGTFSGKKLRLCDAVLTIVGFSCSYFGRKPTSTSVKKIVEWPACRNVKEVRGFLGTVGPARQWIWKYAEIARPLVKLTAGKVADKDFRWTAEAEEAFKAVKEAVANCGWIRPVDYESPNQVYLAVDSSQIAVGWELGQDHEEKRRPARFGSVTFNEREGRYSQAKLELYGVFRALKQCRTWLYGRPVRLEVDAKYLIEMINAPELPNSAMTRWLWFIHHFDLRLVHVPANQHKVVDGLSRRRGTDTDTDDGDAEEFLDKTCGVIQVVAPDQREPDYRTYLIQEIYDPKWQKLGRYLETHDVSDLPPKEQRAIREKSKYYFIRDGKIYRRVHNEMPREVLGTRERRLKVIQEAHEQGGHKGRLSLRHRVSLRFYWPRMAKDVDAFVKSCDRCQRRDPRHYELESAAVHPSDIGQTWGIDLVTMPEKNGYRYIVIARDDLSKWVEAAPLKAKNPADIAKFILDNIITRYGFFQRLKSDRVTEFLKEVKYQLARFNIHHVKTSSYHPEANGVVERGNGPFKEALHRLALDADQRWPELICFACWAERTTVSRTTGYTPYQLMMGQECVLPFDLEEATFLVRGLKDGCTTEELLSHRTRQLQRRQIDLELAHERLKIAREIASRDHNLRYDRRMVEPYTPGQWVLLRNSSLDNTMAMKQKDKWSGPYIVVSQTPGKAYRLREVDGSEFAEYYSHNRLRPYYRRSEIELLQEQAAVEADIDEGEMSEDEETEDYTWARAFNVPQTLLPDTRAAPRPNYPV